MTTECCVLTDPLAERLARVMSDEEEVTWGGQFKRLVDHLVVRDLTGHLMRSVGHIVVGNLMGPNAAVPWWLI